MGGPKGGKAGSSGKAGGGGAGAGGCKGGNAGNSAWVASDYGSSYADDQHRGGGAWNGGGGASWSGGGYAKDQHRGGGGKDGRKGGSGKPAATSAAATSATVAPSALSAAAEHGQPKFVPLYSAQEGGSARPRVPLFSELPAWSAADEVRAACRRSQVICVQGETGCGKSSVLPMIFLDDPGARILVTQPRRIAAISLAQRVASTRNEAVGQTIGYRVAMEGQSSDATRLSFVTTGWLLMFLAHRPDALRRYTHIVLDEIHERDLDMDLLCLVMRRSLPTHPHLRLVLMSATMDASQFLGYFGAERGVNVEHEPIVVGSRRFPTYPFFLDEIASGALQGFSPKVRLDKFERIGGRVDVNVQLFDVCVGIVEAVAKPGLCVLIFLPGLSEMQQLHESFLAHGRGSCKLSYHMLHSIIPHEQQKLALEPPPLGHCKVVLSTNIAESSVTIPDVRYILDFGIVRTMVFDEERAMQSLCNTWSSQATCRQRRGRCGRLQEGVIIYLFPRSLYERLEPYAAPEVLGVPLESIYLKSKVLLHHLGPPEQLLQHLIDSPPQQRITTAAQNLRDLGALRIDGSVASLGRIAVFMPTTIQLTKLVVLTWALGIPADGIVIAAALSTQDVFKLAAPTNCRWPEEFPSHLAHNYIARAKYDQGQFSEPIMYRNLFMDYLKVPKGKAGPYNKWLDESCVSASRMSQFSALVIELASKLGAAIPSAKQHPALETLIALKRSQQLSQPEINDLFTRDYERLKSAIVGAFQPSFVQGEINTQNKNKGKINSCGFDPMKTCLLQQIKPAEMADVNNLWHFCKSLAPIKDLKLNDTGKIAFIECGDDSDCGVPPSDVVHQMPLLAQLLHQLMRQRCKFQVLTDQGIKHEPSPIGSPNFLGGMKWHVNGQRTIGAPYNRSNMGYMCEMRSELKCHWGVCSSLLGREGPDQVRISGLTILPPPGTMIGTVMILAFLSGPFKVTFLGNQEEGFYGVQIVALDVQGYEARPMVLSFAPGWFVAKDIRLLNSFRAAMNEVMTSPEQHTADEACSRYDELMEAVRKNKQAWNVQNKFLPDADYNIANDPQVVARMVAVPNGSLELFQVGRIEIAVDRSAAKLVDYGSVQQEGPDATLRVARPWLRALQGLARRDLDADLAILCQRFGLRNAHIVTIHKHGLPVGEAVEIVGAAQAVEAARAELTEGLLGYYEKQVEWAAASELPNADLSEPALAPAAPATGARQASGRAHRAARAAPLVQAVTALAAVKEAAPVDDDVWGAAPQVDAEPSACGWEAPPAAPEDSATEDAWGAPPAAEVTDADWDAAPEEVAPADWGGTVGPPGLAEALLSRDLGHRLADVAEWADSEGAVSLEEILENAESAAEALGLDAIERQRLAALARERGC